MSRIDDMIRQMCPSGVPYRRLGELARIRNGRDFKHLGSGPVPVYGSGGVMRYVSEAVYDHPSVLIPRKGSLNNLFYVDVPFWTVDTIFFTEVGKELDVRYFYHYLKMLHLERLNQAGGVPSLTQKALNGVLLAIPPIDIQREIVIILEEFVELETILASELRAELEARQQQYAYYQNQLIWENNAPRVTLGEVGALTRGRRFTRNDIADQGVPAIHYGEIYTTYGISTRKTISHVASERAQSLRYAEPGDVIIAGVGETVEEVGIGVAWLGNHPVAYHDDSFALHHQQDPRYISHVLRTSEYHRQKDRFVSRAKVKRLSARGIEQITIPLPPLSEQRRIADILGNFDSLVSDISSGIPAEIEARRQQYEYYRDRLLTFPEKAV